MTPTDKREFKYRLLSLAQAGAGCQTLSMGSPMINRDKLTETLAIYGAYVALFPELNNEANDKPKAD